MKFIHLTDTHYRKNFDDLNIGIDYNKLTHPRKNLEQILSGIDWDEIDFLVNTGDIIFEGTMDDYKVVSETYDQFVPEEIDIYNVAGNHDLSEYFTEYAFVDYKEGYRLVGLHTHYGEFSRGYIREKELNWLKNLLSEPCGKGTLLFLHQPLMYPGLEYMCLLNADELISALEGSDVIGIFTGHAHRSGVYNLNIGGKIVPQYTANSAAFSMRENGDGELIFSNSVGYSVVTIDDNGGILYEAKGLDVEPKLVFNAEDFANRMKESSNKQEERVKELDK